MNHTKNISPWAWVPTLYFAQGIPYFIVNNISVMMFTKMGVPNGEMYVGNEEFPPLRITGTELTGSEISLAGNVSSQYISALLMIGTVLPKGLRLHLTGDIISRP